MSKSSKISFHVRHEVRPDRVIDILKRIAQESEFHDITQSDRQVTRARNLGLVAADGTALTRLGQTVVSLVNQREQLWGELGHYLHYTIWNPDTVEDNAFSFLYQLFCDFLYEQETFSTDASRDELERICIELGNQIENVARFQNYIDGDLSLSPDSLRGILVWLEALKPPVIDDGRFERRAFCSPELLLLAIGFVMRDEPEAVDIDILLSRRRRDEICRVCLLDPTALDQTLDWMIPLYPNVVVSTEEAGYYGRYIRLRKRPTLEDVMR